jgi:hypothetical protein
MVLFDLSTLRKLVADTSVRGMFFLPESTELDLHSHVVLTSQGTLAANRYTPKLIDPISKTVFSEGEMEASLYERFSDRFDLFPVDDVDCLAIGETPPFPPVLLHLRAEAGYGEARAVFAEAPSEQHYELLKAIGVEYLGGSREGPYYVARFRNHLPIHIHSGMLARFTRTSHCNLFFLRHGSIDRQLESGLIKASTGRVSWAAQRAREAVVRLANEAANGELALTCQPSPPTEPFASGDVVPLGFLLKALNCHTSPASIFRDVEVRKRLISLLQHRRQESLWPHKAGGPVSSTASALVLQGSFRDPEGLEALEVFADGRGGYYSRLLSDERAPGAMASDGGNGYRCQPDFATTCLIRALRNDAELDTKASAQYLASRFESRSGLYFANPYLVDWALASALEKEQSARKLRNLLATEILASMNDDYSFGLFDVPMSSAFAILSLAALGHRNRILRMAQLRLLDFMEPDGTFPAGTPFYCARVVKQQERALAGTPARGDGEERRVIRVDREPYEVSLCLDGRNAISTASATLALLTECSPAARDSDPVGERWGEAHPRYRCRDHAEYVQKFALPPYVSGSPRV